MTRARATTAKRRRSRERWRILAAFVLAAAAGLVATQLGTPRSWEHAPTSVSTTSVPFVEPQGNP